MKKARTFHANRLQKTCWKAWRKYIELLRQHWQQAGDWHEQQLLRAALRQWQKFVAEAQQEKNSKAVKLYTRVLLHKTFNIWWEVRT